MDPLLTIHNCCNDVFPSMLYIENTEQRGTRIENGLEWSNGTVHFDWTGPTEKSGLKGGLIFSKLFRLD